MVKINVYQIDKFLQVINHCTGSVYLILADGKKTNLNKNIDLQLELLRKHEENNLRSVLCLEMHQTSDYLDIIYFSMGDC